MMVGMGIHAALLWLLYGLTRSSFVAGGAWTMTGLWLGFGLGQLMRRLRP